jgi:hypothetical protein
VLDAYADRIDGLYVESDAGQSDALQRGFARAGGQILGWLNADDMLMPDALERAVLAFRGADAPDVVYGHCAFLGADDQFLRYFHEIKPFSAARLVNDSNFIAQPSTFFSRDAYQEVGGIDPGLRYTMDWDLWCRLATADHRFELVDEVLSAARLYPETKTSSGGVGRWREILRTNDRYRTSRLPRAAIGHLYVDLLRPVLDPIRPAIRWLRPLLTDAEFLQDTQVCGLERDGSASTAGFALRFPLQRVLDGVSLRFSSEVEAAHAGFAVTLAGRPLEVAAGTRADGRIGWRAACRLDDGASVPAIDLEVRPRGFARALLFEGIDLDLRAREAVHGGPGRRAAEPAIHYTSPA